MVETFVVEDGYNPRNSGYNDWKNEGYPISVYFEPYCGAHPVFCDCIAMFEKYAVLKVPSRASDDSSTKWFPTDDESLCIVPEVFVRPQ
jgi:hypothetical protein